MDIPSILLAQAPTPLPPDDPAPIVISPGPADAAATARFSELMAPPPSAIAEAVQQAYPMTPPVANPTMGDSILAGLQNLSSDFQQSWKTVNTVLTSQEKLTIPDMLKLQMGLVQMSIQYELVGKAISRSTQNLDQLVKLQ